MGSEAAQVDGPRNILPRWFALALGGIMLAAVSFALVARTTGHGASTIPESPTIASLDLTFTDEANGGILIRRADDGRLVEHVAPGTNGFIRTVMRGIVHERRQHGGGPETAFTLSRRADGRLMLFDPVSQRRIALNSFGMLNAQGFGRLLASPQGKSS
jgi:putative photosynthetic complex assembly protein